jgi:hypothetical protein
VVPSQFHGRLALAGLTLALLLLAGCAGRRSPPPVDQARLQFSREAYCPLRRVVAERVVPMPEAPARIARDAERLAMWRAAHQRDGLDDPRQTIAVTGCGERSTYACWATTGREPAGRGMRTVYLGASCSEVP